MITLNCKCVFVEVLSDGERCDGSRVVVNDNSDDGKLSPMSCTTHVLQLLYKVHGSFH